MKETINLVGKTENRKRKTGKLGIDLHGELQPKIFDPTIPNYWLPPGETPMYGSHHQYIQAGGHMAMEQR
eukprot:11853829-Ditylum_brightwellii.AAC.1